MGRLPVIFDAQWCFSWQYSTQCGYLRPWCNGNCNMVFDVTAWKLLNLILGITTFGGFGGHMMLLGHPFCHGSSSSSGSLKIVINNSLSRQFVVGWIETLALGYAGSKRLWHHQEEDMVLSEGAQSQRKIWSSQDKLDLDFWQVVLSTKYLTHLISCLQSPMTPFLKKNKSSRLSKNTILLVKYWPSCTRWSHNLLIGY